MCAALINRLVYYSSSHLYSCLQLSAAVAQDAESQIQSFPRALWMFNQVQQGPETTVTSESGNASLASLDVLRPDGYKGSPLRDFEPLVGFSAAARTCLALFLAFRPRSGYANVSQAPGQRRLW